VAQALARYDRRVLHSRLTVGSKAPRHTIVSSIEEALRLCSLPGEDEGRTYYFRRLDISLPENASRKAWLEGFERGLQELARNAVDGRHTHAADADAVFFRSEQEACESLAALVARREAPAAWFWASVSGAPLAAPPAVHVRGLIEKLSQSEASWMAVAALVFASPNPVSLLKLLPQAAVRQWLRELGCADAPARGDAPVSLADSQMQPIRAAASAFGREDPRAIWLTALGVILARASALQTGRAIAHALTILRGLAKPQAPENQDPETYDRPTQRGEDRQLPDNELPEDTVIAGEQRSEGAHASRSVEAQPTTKPGDATSGAGLYFLLNALKYLKFPASSLEPQVLPLFLLRVARRAGIGAKDPILVWALEALEDARPIGSDEALLRPWIRKVRRWCWTHGKIGIREIVRRQGYVKLTPTDLDVFLALDSVDIRIRRLGLDLDLGWAPWFGRVVRFHYRDRGELYD